MSRSERIRIILPLVMTGIVAFAIMIVAVRTISNSPIPEPVPEVKSIEPQENIANLVMQITETPETPNMAGMPETLIKSRDWTAEDREILLKIAMAEAEGECTEGKAMVMLVVLNRVFSDGFPDSIEDVVFQNSDGLYQFSPMEPGGRYWTTTPNADCRLALNMVENGWDESQGALFFEGCTGDSWHSRNLDYLFTVGGHRFYK